MIETPEYNVTAHMLSDGSLTPVDESNADEFLAGRELRVLFFSGPNAVRREAHDVAVALRELLRSYAGQLVAGHVDDESTPALQERFRVTATPCIVFAIAGEVLEVMPRVRDWSEYSAAFGRYLGPGTTQAQRMETA
jgi:hypothetical protein